LQNFRVDKVFTALYTIRILFQTAKAPRKYRGVVAAFYKESTEFGKKTPNDSVIRGTITPEMIFLKNRRRTDHEYGYGSIWQ
jgi:hypothetical protein